MKGKRTYLEKHLSGPRKKSRGTPSRRGRRRRRGVDGIGRKRAGEDGHHARVGLDRGGLQGLQE